MIYAATSSFRPDVAVLDLAADKSAPYYQRVRHVGAEIYWNTPSFLISAGGMQTPYANRPFLAGMPSWTSLVPIGLPPVSIPAGNDDDRGAALPTTLIPHAGKEKLNRNDFIRIAGEEVAYDIDGKREFSFDHNLCVWKGFACGINLRIPAVLEDGGCLTRTTAGSPLERRTFFDSSAAACLSYAGDAPQKFYVAIRLSCLNGDTTCGQNHGFFEAFSNPADTFPDFIRKVTQANLGLRGATRGVYQSYAGPSIHFDATAHQDHGSRWGIVAVDGQRQPDLDDWPLFDGDVITSQRHDGLITIRNTRLARTVELDFRSANKPMRTVR